MPDGQLIKCDACGHEWRGSIEVRRARGGGELWHLKCPKCGEDYRIARITRRGVELREELNAARDAGDRDRAAELAMLYEAEVRNLRTEGKANADD